MQKPKTQINRQTTHLRLQSRFAKNSSNNQIRNHFKVWPHIYLYNMFVSSCMHTRLHTQCEFHTYPYKQFIRLLLVASNFLVLSFVCGKIESFSHSSYTMATFGSIAFLIENAPSLRTLSLLVRPYSKTG